MGIARSEVFLCFVLDLLCFSRFSSGPVKCCILQHFLAKAKKPPKAALTNKKPKSQEAEKPKSQEAKKPKSQEAKSGKQKLKKLPLRFPKTNHHTTSMGHLEERHPSLRTNRQNDYMDHLLNKIDIGPPAIPLRSRYEITLCPNSRKRLGCDFVDPLLQDSRRVLKRTTQGNSWQNNVGNPQKTHPIRFLDKWVLRNIR